MSSLKNRGPSGKDPGGGEVAGSNYPPAIMKIRANATGGLPSKPVYEIKSKNSDIVK